MALTLFAAVGLIILLLLPRASAEEGGFQAAAQSSPSVGLDLDPEGDSAAFVAAIDSCVSVEKGEAFDVDVYVKDVSNLLAWEVYFRYDQSRLEILRADVRMFLRNQAGSNVVSVSDPLPNKTGLYRIAAADIASPSALESGSGILTRVTLEAKESGTTPISLPHLDFNGDDVYDLGPRLIGPGGTDIDDADGDGLLDGQIDSARVVVGSSCAAAPEVSPTPWPVLGTTNPGGTPGPDGQNAQSTATPSADATSSPGAGGSSPSGDTNGGQGDGGTPADPEGTPAGGSSAGTDGSHGGSGGGGSSVLTLIAGAVGVAGALGLLLVLAALRQTRRHINT
ncbi:MAG: cohesin domain-containing protein [Dehalococcoidia bacterium]|nr:cohesin domain-containing protein [Dehalococcoidia bacterium]